MSNLRINAVDPSTVIDVSAYNYIALMESIDPENTHYIHRQRLYRVEIPTLRQAAYSRLDYMFEHGELPD